MFIKAKEKVPNSEGWTWSKYDLYVNSDKLDSIFISEYADYGYLYIGEKEYKIDDKSIIESVEHQLLIG